MFTLLEYLRGTIEYAKKGGNDLQITQFQTTYIYLKSGFRIAVWPHLRPLQITVRL